MNSGHSSSVHLHSLASYEVVEQIWPGESQLYTVISYGLHLYHQEG